ncbi:hypothetical protein OAZ20_05545 [Paracoccaceae bacterium]|nr:hypothetical protein [Paracoccaceae bacterium]
MRNMVLSFVAGISLLLASSILANTEVENKLGIRFYGSFLYSEKVPNALFFFSDIEKNDSFELRKALRNHDIEILVLASKGGSVWEGLNMAGIIHDKELITYVPTVGLESKKGNCASACSFMFFGGSTRIADGKLGVHQFYSGSASESAKIGTTQKVAQFTVSEIIGFLNEFETPPFVYERMFQQSKMYYFDDQEMDQITRVAKPLEQEEQANILAFILALKQELALLENKNEKEEEPSQQIEVVKQIQKELNRLNCNAGIADGIIGKKTKAALKRYASATNTKIDNTALKDRNFLSNIKKVNTKCNKAVDLVCTNPVRRGGAVRDVSVYKSISIFDYQRELDADTARENFFDVKVCMPDGCIKSVWSWGITENFWPVNKKQFVDSRISPEPEESTGRSSMNRKTKPAKLFVMLRKDGYWSPRADMYFTKCKFQ